MSKTKEYCTCTDSHICCPGGIETAFCAYCRKPIRLGKDQSIFTIKKVISPTKVLVACSKLPDFNKNLHNDQIDAMKYAFASIGYHKPRFWDRPVSEWPWWVILVLFILSCWYVLIIL